jgi:hypothetical protein
MYSGRRLANESTGLWLAPSRIAMFFRAARHSRLSERHPLETHGPFGTLWVGLGLCAFYIALIWINSLLGFVLTPLFIGPATWLMDRVRGKAEVRG